MTIIEKGENGVEDELCGASFGLSDILRIVVGLLIASQVVLRVLTGNWVTGFKREREINNGSGKEKQKLDHYWVTNEYTLPYNFTLEELSKFSGQHGSAEVPIVLAINGSVFDVSSSRHLYGKWGPYRKFSGKDCSNNFQFGIFDHASYTSMLECDWDISGLDDAGREMVQQWHHFFEKKYPLVGHVVF